MTTWRDTAIIPENATLPWTLLMRWFVSFPLASGFFSPQSATRDVRLGRDRGSVP